MAPKYKLTYFPLSGLAEPIRFILSYMGADFEDVRIEYKDWPAMKPNSPFGKLPYFEVDGKVMCQSAVIARYLGKIAGIAGDNDWEDAKISVVADVLRDMIIEFGAWAREADPAIKAKKGETFKNETMPFYLGRLDKLAKENGGFLANNKLSWGDLYFAAVFEFLLKRTNIDDTSKYPNLQNLSKTVFNIPKIKTWVSKRPADKPRN